MFNQSLSVSSDTKRGTDWHLHTQGNEVFFLDLRWQGFRWRSSHFERSPPGPSASACHWKQKDKKNQHLPVCADAGTSITARSKEILQTNYTSIQNITRLKSNAKSYTSATLRLHTPHSGTTAYGSPPYPVQPCFQGTHWLHGSSVSSNVSRHSHTNRSTAISPIRVYLTYGTDPEPAFLYTGSCKGPINLHFWVIQNDTKAGRLRKTVRQQHEDKKQQSVPVRVEFNKLQKSLVSKKCIITLR